MDYFEARRRLHGLGFDRDEDSATSNTYVNGNLKVVLSKDFINAEYGKCSLGGYLKNLDGISRDQDLILFDFENAGVEFPLENR